MIWIAGFIAMLAAGVLLSHVLLSPRQPHRKTRPPLVWRKTTPVRRPGREAVAAPASGGTDACYLMAALDHGYGSAATHDSPSACDTDSGGFRDSGDCGSDGGSFD